jgi:RNA polymerase sigma-70 factor (ECF subfamily)
LDDAQAVAAMVERCLSGDASAWEDLVRLYHRRVYNVCYRFAGSADDAEDLTQEVFIKVYRTLKSYDLSKGAFVTWMTTIARNLLVDHFRRSKHERMTNSLESAPGGSEDALTLGEQLPDLGPGPEAGVRTQETQVAVHQALQKLSPDLREAVILRDLQDLEYREIAQVLRVPEGTVKSRINRGRAELARLLSRTYRQVS